MQVFPRRTSAYICTLNPDSIIDMGYLAFLRGLVKQQNDFELCTFTEPNKFCLRIQPRLGKNSPFRHRYSRRGLKRIAIAHAQRLDVYLGRR